MIFRHTQILERQLPQFFKRHTDSKILRAHLYSDFAFGKILRDSRENLRTAVKNILAQIGRFVRFLERTHNQQSVLQRLKMSALQNDRPNLHESSVSLDSWDGHTTNYQLNNTLTCPSVLRLPAYEKNVL